MQNFIELLKEKNRYSITLFMMIMTLLSFSFSVFRIIYTDSIGFIFLNWNLFLAFIPWALTTLCVLYPKLIKKKISIAFVLVIWLLFFPNAPYILTDLFHLRLKLAMPVWFDLIFILSYAWTGLLFGFLSLWDIEGILKKFINPTLVTILSVILLFVGSFGIYVGRYLRWNSWDMFTDPFKLIYVVGERIVNPFSHPATYGMTFFMGVFLNMIYWSFKIIKKTDSH